MYSKVLYIYIYIYIHTHTHTVSQLWASLVAQMVKNLPAMQETACNTRDAGLIPESGISLEKEMANGYPLQ